MAEHGWPVPPLSPGWGQKLTLFTVPGGICVQPARQYSWKGGESESISLYARKELKIQVLFQEMVADSSLQCFTDI